MNKVDITVEFAMDRAEIEEAIWRAFKHADSTSYTTNTLYWRTAAADKLSEILSRELNVVVLEP